MRDAVLVMLLMLLPGCSSSGPGSTSDAPRGIDFSHCPWDGRNGTPASCTDGVTHYTAGNVPSNLPCLDQTIPGPTTVRVRKDLQGPVVELTAEAGPLWSVVVVFGDDVAHAYQWMQPSGTSWTYLQGAPTTGAFHLLLTSFKLSVANATQSTAEALAKGVAVRWVVAGPTLAPLIVLGDPPMAYVAATLPLGSPPFTNEFSNAHLTGKEYEVVLSEARNMRVDLQLRDPNPNGLSCTLPV